MARIRTAMEIVTRLEFLLSDAARMEREGRVLGAQNYLRDEIKKLVEEVRRAQYG